MADRFKTCSPFLALRRQKSFEAEEPDDAELLRQLLALQNDGASASDAARQLAQTTGLSRRRLYALLHQSTSD